MKPNEKSYAELNAEIRTIRAQWIGVKDENSSLIDQIEYLNKDAKKSHDRIMELEFQLKENIQLRAELKESIKELLPIVERTLLTTGIWEGNLEQVKKDKLAFERAEKLIQQ